MGINYSIIIPHRNSPELLQRAILSIPDRSDIQIIVIDNSTYCIDFGSLDIRKNSSFLLLYSDQTKGAGHARNEGLKSVKGNWILFIDADDFFNPGAFERFDAYLKFNYDIVYFSLNSIYSDTYLVAERHKYNNSLVNDFLTGKSNSEDALRYKYITPICKLIKAELIFTFGIAFDEVPAGNDMMFSVKSGYYAKSIMADKFQASCITISRGSLTNTINSVNSRSRYYALIHHYKYMVSIGKPQMRYFLMAEVVKSLRFGLKEFWWYLNVARIERINIFLGFERWPGVLYKYLFCRTRNDGYSVIIKR
jgi:glycosyltransferase involved in cell wall biosynthesis